MGKLIQSQVEESMKLRDAYWGFDQKNKARHDAEVKEADAKIVEGKIEYDKARLLGVPDLWERWTEFEKLQIKRRLLSENYAKEKNQLADRLTALTRPVILSCCEDLLKEVKRIDGLKKFEIIDDKEDAHSERQGSRVFSCNHNFFKCHSAQKEIMTGIESLRGMELESLVTIRDKYNSIVEAIPSEFPFEFSEGKERLREFFFENKPKEDIDLALGQSVWLSQTKFLSEFESKVQSWKAKELDKKLGELVSKHRGPIEIDMT